MGGAAEQHQNHYGRRTPNGDAKTDLMLFGNYYGNNVQMGRYDADYGTLLINKGNAAFEAVPLNGTIVKGEVRRAQPCNIQGKPAYVLAKNNDSLQVIRFRH